MNDTLFAILQIVATAALTLIIRYLVPFLIQLLRQHNYSFAADIVEHLVRAAEQTIIGSGRGTERFEQVMKTAKQLLEANRIQMTEEQIEKLIEAAVQIMNAEAIKIETVSEEQPEEGNADE